MKIVILVVLLSLLPDIALAVAVVYAIKSARKQYPRTSADVNSPTRVIDRVGPLLRSVSTRGPGRHRG